MKHRQPNRTQKERRAHRMQVRELRKRVKFLEENLDDNQDRAIAAENALADERKRVLELERKQSEAESKIDALESDKAKGLTVMEDLCKRVELAEAETKEWKRLHLDASKKLGSANQNLSSKTAQFNQWAAAHRKWADDMIRFHYHQGYGDCAAGHGKRFM